MLHLNCTESNCTVQLESMAQLNDHLRTVHRLGHFKCFARNCNALFDKSAQMTVHLQLCHTRYSRLVCAVCQKEYDSQHQANTHWYHYHLTGQFQCKLASDCAQVTSTRVKMAPHLRTHVVVPAKPLNQSNDFHCDFSGCSASFAFNAYLKEHQTTHLNSQSFHCDFPQCNHRTNLRDSLLRHIRKRHFGLPATVKEQNAMNIPNIYIDGRDPSEYVQLVVDTE